MRSTAILVMVLAAAAGSAAPPPPEWIPARWHSHDIALLPLLTQSPVNCILLEPADWDPAFLRAAASDGIAALAVIRVPDNARVLVDRALHMNVAGVLLEGDFDVSIADAVRAVVTRAHRTYIELPSRARIRLDTADPVTGTNQGLWPGLEIEHNGKTVAGPTSSPWINTNGGFLRFLRARTGAAGWLAVDPPPHVIFPVERYLQAVGDAAIPGARWVVSLDADFESRLLRHDPPAVQDWNRIAGQLRFYEKWRHAAGFGTFGVVMDRNTGGLLSSFLLDMLAAQRTSARVIPPGRVSTDSLRRISVLLDLEPATLTADERAAVRDFVSRGGVILDPPATARFPEPSPQQMIPNRRDLDRLQGLWEMVYNATLRKNFGVRAFNTTGILTGVATNDAGRSVIVQLLNFMDYAGEQISVHALGTWKRAVLYTPGTQPRELRVYPVKEGTAVDVDRLSTSAAIHFE